MDRRSSKLLVIGAAVFVAGAGLVFIGLRSGASDRAQPEKPTVIESPTPDDRVVAQAPSTTQVVAVPSRYEAVAVQLPTVPGLGGYARAGDLINIYAAVEGGEGVSGLAPPYAKRVFGNVEVLDVQGGDGITDPTFLLAMRPRDAERLIFYASFEKLWATLSSPRLPNTTTSGVDHGTKVP